MTNKVLEGRGSVYITMDFKLLHVGYYYEAFIAGKSFEEPDSEEFFEIVYVKYGGEDIMSSLQEDQLEDIVTEIKKQCKGYVDSYTDNDSNRPAVNKIIQKELGFGFNEDWSDK